MPLTSVSADGVSYGLGGLGFTSQAIPNEVQQSQLYSGVLRLVATTGTSGFVLQNATPTIITWTAPNDGNMHRVLVMMQLTVVGTASGGSVSVTYYDFASNSHTSNLVSGGKSAGNYLSSADAAFPVPAGQSISLVQGSALTAGAITVWAELWAA